MSTTQGYPSSFHLSSFAVLRTGNIQQTLLCKFKVAMWVQILSICIQWTLFLILLLCVRKVILRWNVRLPFMARYLGLITYQWLLFKWFKIWSVCEVQKSMVTDPLTDLPTIKINLQQKITPKLLPKVTTLFF